MYTCYLNPTIVDMPEFLVIYGESKKVCYASTKAELYGVVRSKFEMPTDLNIIFQVFNSTCEDWVDTETSGPPDGGKVKVIIKQRHLVIPDDPEDIPSDSIEGTITALKSAVGTVKAAENEPTSNQLN